MAKRVNRKGGAATKEPKRCKDRSSDNGNSTRSADRPTLAVKTDDKGRIFSHIRQKWLVEIPEERVRQAYVVTLHNEYGFDLEQMDEELVVTGRASARARADVVIWRTVQDKADSKAPLIVVECKADNVTIKPADYDQGERYARQTDAPFLVTHNNRETRYWRVKKDRMPGYMEEIENIPHADASDKDIQELIAKLRTFKEDEFADLLHQCHNVLRNREHLDPAAAFDEIAKILFVKVWVEREMKRKRQRQNLFTADWMDTQLGENPLQELFRQTKEAYHEDCIFDDREQLDLKAATGREIVRLLERYNLSDTSEDVKGIAFERFLGRTFRGEIGQFFTPRTIVEFMVRMLNPREGDVVCDPASGSGGFLIRFFELVREQILADVDQQYQTHAAELAKKKISEAKRAALLRKKYAELQQSIDQRKRDSRLWKLANRCIYGTDANERMARTSKMNMIMHGDGHGGVHKHNGFINVNGIFEGRFDLILTNPPFGANVEPSDRITEDELRIGDETYRRYADTYGQLYRDAQARVQASKGKPIASLFELPKRNGSNLGKVKTEILFIERCLSLLKPGGRMGIVLPEGIFNNPSLEYVRDFCEDRARILAVVSLPPATFKSTGADVRASLLFLHKYTRTEAKQYATIHAAVKKQIDARSAKEVLAGISQLKSQQDAAKRAKYKGRMADLAKEIKGYMAGTGEIRLLAIRAAVRDKWNYPVFLYRATLVGITATGEPTENELYPNVQQPSKTRKTCLELYRDFKHTENRPQYRTTKGIQIRDASLLVPWKNLTRWDLKGARAIAFRLASPDFRPLGDFVEEATVLVRPWEIPDHLWPVYGVSNREGVVLSHYQRGSEFNSPYKRIEKDWFFHNPTRANVGSLGRVPRVPSDAITSPEYQVWRIKHGLIPEYVEMLINTPFFLGLVDFHRVGAVKERLFVQNLMEIPIPVLDRAAQKAMAQRWSRAQRDLARVRRRVELVRRSLTDDFLGRCSPIGLAIVRQSMNESTTQYDEKATEIEMEQG